MRGTNILSVIAKGLLEQNLGRLRTIPNCWRLTDKVTRRETMAGFGHTSQDAFARPTTLIKTRGVYCPDIERMGRDNAIDKQGCWATVRLTECRKCQYHRTARQQHLSFPTCTFKGEQSKAGAQVKSLVQISLMWQEADNKVKGSAEMNEAYINAYHEVKADVLAKHLAQCREFLGPVVSVPDSVGALVEAAKVLMEFAKTAPGRLPERVRLACQTVEKLP